MVVAMAPGGFVRRGQTGSATHRPTYRRGEGWFLGAYRRSGRLPGRGGRLVRGKDGHDSLSQFIVESVDSVDGHDGVPGSLISKSGAV